MSEPKNILVADDSENDFFLIKGGFRKAGLHHKFFHVADGKKAFAYLNGEDGYSDRATWPFPHLLLLDIKMPGVDGFDLLRLLCERPDIKVPFIAMLSGSIVPEDARTATDLGAAAYYVKPHDTAELETLARAINERFFI